MLNTHETNVRIAGSELYPASWIILGGSVKGSRCVRVKQVISTVSVSKWDPKADDRQDGVGGGWRRQGLWALRR
jgi:hypothetical protein